MLRLLLLVAAACLLASRCVGVASSVPFKPDGRPADPDRTRTLLQRGREALKAAPKNKTSFSTLSSFVDPGSTRVAAANQPLKQQPRKQGVDCLTCPDVSECQPVNGAPSCSCPPDQFSRLINDVCTAAPLRGWGWLDPHSSARAAVGAQPLVWSPVLASQAQNWANFLSSDSMNCQLQLGGTPKGVGQNVANFFNDPSVKNFGAMNLWVAQGAQYSYSVFDTNGDGGCATGNWQDCAAYTQVIWNNTRRIGCGVGFCPSISGKVWVCHYWPAGNIIGQLPYTQPQSQ